MAAPPRASLTDDDSVSDHLILEMVRINAPHTTSPIIHQDPDEHITLDDSIGTLGVSMGPIQTDFLAMTNPSLMDGLNGEYEIPNLFTYKKVRMKKKCFFFLIAYFCLLD